MHELLTAQPGSKKLLLGNEAIVRGALEAGISFTTTYPGTPSSEIGDNFYRISQETDLYFEYSVNEKVALETAAAAAISGLRTLCSMKHVGLNVAADALMTLAYVGVKGGLVVVSADDPSMHSSQNEQDNRYYAKLAGLPMLEPANSQEALEMTGAAFELSEAYQIPVLLRTTTRVNHSRTPVEVGLLQPPRRTLPGSTSLASSRQRSSKLVQPQAANAASHRGSEKTRAVMRTGLRPSVLSHRARVSRNAIGNNRGSDRSARPQEGRRPGSLLREPPAGR